MITDLSTAISAIVVAIQMISNFCKKLKWIRKIVLVTNGSGFIDADDIEKIVDKFKEDDIEVIILYVFSWPFPSVLAVFLVCHLPVASVLILTREI